jgi:hypothetical protein
MAENITTDNVVSGDSFDEKTEPTYEDKVVGYDTANSKNIKIIISSLAKKIITGGTVQTTISGADSIPVYNAGGAVAGYITYANLASALAAAGTAQTAMADADRIKLYNAAGGIAGYITYANLKAALSSTLGTNWPTALASELGAGGASLLGLSALKSNMATALANNLNWGRAANAADIPLLTTDVITSLLHVGDYAAFASTAPNVPDAHNWYVMCEVGGYSATGARYRARRTGGYEYIGDILTAGTVTWIKACTPPVGFVYFQGTNDADPATLYPNTTWDDVSWEEANTTRRTIGSLAGARFTGVPAHLAVSVTGNVPSITITNGGSGYLSGGNGTITLTVVGTCTTQATRTATVTSGVITAINVVAAGAGYTSGAVAVYDGVARYADMVQGHIFRSISLEGASEIKGSYSVASGSVYNVPAIAGTGKSVIATNISTDGTNGTPRIGAQTSSPWSAVTKWRRTA